MEILKKFKENGYFTAELYHLLAKKKLLDPSTDICPSQYVEEMKMTTQQRLQNLNNMEIDNIVSLGNQPTKVVLLFTPRLLVFQNFKPNEKVITKFSVKNISKAPTFINMVFKESSYFSIKTCGGQLLSRLAPGISVSFAITFLPVQYDDYIHRVTFYTDVDQYVLPMIAFGPRPIFNIPDSILIPKTPLKVEMHFLMTIKNTGVVPAGLTLSTKSPFSVHPKSAYLLPSENIDIKVKLKTMYLGEVQGVLYAILETGENFRVQLNGCTHTVNIELERQIVRFFDTYKTMMRQQTFKIFNKSDHVLTYMCMKNEYVYYDFKDKLKLATSFYDARAAESAKNKKLVYYDVLSSEEHERIYTRIFFDEIQTLVADESLTYQNTHFNITPIKGNLWPNKATELTITFCPKNIGEFRTRVYLDIDGVLERVPLELVGISIPPCIHLNIETLDMDRVYINKLYNYEIVAINKGHINGIIVYKEVPTLFGSTITCSPAMHCLRPGEKQIFVISFCNSNQGPFFEEINFSIRDTDVFLKLYLKGEVVYPSLRFSVPCLDFGTVSIGVPKFLELDVINESIVSIVGSVKISSDGPEISSITLLDYAVAEKPKPQVPQWPREFNIEPWKVDIKPESRITLKVTLVANLVRANQTSLELELEKSDSPPIVLPVIFNALVPYISPAPDIKMRACFLDFPYEIDIAVTSDNLKGYFTLEEPKETSLEVYLAVDEGYIEPNSTLTIPITIKTSILGMQEYVMRMNLFGMSKPIEICNITGCGVRPIVTCNPMALHWGQVKLLSTSQKCLTLCNDSPVVVNYKASLLNKDGRWQITPTEGHVDPESETDLLLSLYLVDVNTYTNKAVIQLEKVKDILVPLSATGVGTSILVGDLRDSISLGRHFTKIPLHCKVIMENRGTKMHVLEWSEHYKAPKMKQPTSGFFNLEPRSFKMAAGEKLELLITGISYKVTTVKEMWYLVGSVEGINKKELLLECQITAEFVDPKIEVSSSLIEFQYDYGPYSEYYKLTDIVTIKNVSKLPLDMEISIKPPFAIIQRSDTYLVTPEEENLCGCIQYRESDLNLQRLIKNLGPHESSVFIDCLTLKPVEPLRQGSLNFFRDINKLKLAFNLTHMVEECLQDRDVMKLQILFDTTKHTNLKSKVYCDVLRIKFKGHKNKDAIKVIGQINYPNILVLTPRVDFQCIQNGSIESKTIKLQNTTPLLVCYSFQWKKCTITDTTLSEPPKKDYPNVSSDVKATTASTTSVLHEVTNHTMVRLEHQQILEDNSIKNEISEQAQATNYHYVGEACESDVDIFADFELLKKRIMNIVTPMIESTYYNQFEWIHKFEKKAKVKKTDINGMFKLIPHRALLKRGEIQYLHLMFQPKTNINVRAILECEVLGGPSETIQVTGRSSELRYKLNAEKINFKIRSFHENAIEELLITNITQLPYEYRTYLTEVKSENVLEAMILELLPPEKQLEFEEEAKMQIVVNPGILGYFHKMFLLEIGHLPHIPIEVYGWGVIPQIYLTLQKPKGIADWEPEIGYKAIPTLTNEYLVAIDEIFTKNKTEHLNSPLMDKCFEDPYFHKEWHICSPWDGYPSTMDIDLAIERLLVIKHVMKRPEVLNAYTTNSKTGPIQGFHSEPYIIDYGVVITGSTVQCIADIINYGPIATKLYFARGTNVPSWLSMKFCGKLNPGEIGKLEVTFTPTSEDFTELEQNVETSFNIEVPYGVSIPIHIKALCAVPYLVSSVTAIDFGSVRCGDKIICSIPIKNLGKPTCIWYVTLRLKCPGPHPMVVMDNSGKYEPGDGGMLSIAFKPTMEMVYDALLIFRFHMNPNRMTIPVTGHGILPRVHVIGPSVNFSPTLPWSEISYNYFGLTNPCPFPIELIIAHSDEKWQVEEEIYQLLYKYYNKPAEMLVPAIRPGAGLPKEVIDFYIMFNERIRRIKEETAMGSGKTTTKTSASTKKSKTAPKTAKTPGATKETDSRSSPIKYRTEAEIIADEMKYQKEKDVDPLKKSLKVFDCSKTVTNLEKPKKGLLVFAHGSPCEETQGQEIACAIGKNLNLPVINVDHCIVHSLLRAKENAQIEILLIAINENYETAKKAMKTDDDFPDEHEEDEFDETEDEFEILLKKVMVLANSKNAATPRSKANDKKKLKKSNPSITSHTAGALFGTTTLFQMELVEDLLTDYFRRSIFHRGFVVESLTSVILKSPPLVLTTVLKCKRSIWNAHLILCHADFSKWVLAYEEAHKEADLLSEPVVSRVFDDTEIQKIVTSLEELDEEEYENAPSELKAIYVVYGLEQRRNKYLEKKQFQKPTAVSLATSKEKGKEAQSKSATTIDAGDLKKKVKKEEYRGKPTSEYSAMSAKYTEYSKTIYENLTNIATNWIFEECDVGYPLYGINGQIAGAVLKKNKKKSEMQLQVSDINLGDRGFPLSLVMSPCLSYKKAVVNMFTHSPVVRDALKDDEEIDILQYPMERREYTVLLPKVFPMINYEEPLQWRYLKEEPLKKCECNQLTDLNLLDDSTQDNVLNILSKWHCTCGKKMTSTQTSTTEIPSTVDKMTGDDVHDELSPLPLHIVESLGTPGNRIVLQPGELVRCKYSFNPQEEGNYSVKRYVEVSGWPDSRMDINVNSICDLPRLDSRPKKMFDNFARRTIEDRVYKLTYLDDQKVFEFGPIFVGLYRIYEEEYIINLKNSSLITADVVIEFLEETTVFQIDKNFIRLEPGCRDKLKISAAPTEEEVHTSVLLFCVKDNPEIVAINIGCSGVKPIVEILPLTKHIEYGRLLLYRREDDRFIVKNDSILSIMWKIRNPQDFIEDFIISKSSGIVPRHDNEVVPVTYIACRVGVIVNKVLIIDIYDAEGRGEPMIIDSLYLSAECYDVTVDCAYENATENFLNYGNVKVNSNVFREMYLLNRGKYDIYFKLKKVKNFPEPSLLKSFQATPETGMIPSSLKLTSIEFECTPTTSMNLVNVPVYTCSLLDGSRDQVVVAKFPVCVTIASFYNTFTLFPLGELNFHIIAVGTAVVRDVILNNTSKCPVTYDIVLPKMYQIDPNAPPPSAKGKDNKIRNPPLKCGNFLILNEDNLLAPGTSRTIQIQFSATASRKFEETINFVISDTCPAEAHGVPLRLVGTGAMPTLDVWNIETTFREHLIVKNLSEYKVPESSPHCVFVEDSVTLHFFCVTVNTRFVGSIDLYNNGLVASALTMKLHFQTNTNADIFSLDKYNSHIEPLMHKNLGIIFTPKALMEYRAVLEIKLKLLDNQEQSFKLCLIGEGVIPRIKVVSPQIKHQRQATFQLPVTCLGSVSFNSISFKNISSIKSIVIIEVIKTAAERRPIFWLTADAENARMIIDNNKDSTAFNFNSEDEFNVSLKIMLNPDVTARININYNPIRKGRSSCDVRLTIVENPYEYFIVTCEGEAFMEDVILMGLTMLPIDTDPQKPSAERIGGSSHASTETNAKRSKSVENKKSVKLTSADLKKSQKRLSAASINTTSSQPAVLRYELDFGGCELCSMQRRTVTMVNNSEKVYKFHWALVDDIVMKPSMGYISPGEEKDLEIMFYSAKPVALEMESLTCTLVAVSDDSLTLDMKGATWDNRQLVTVFQHNTDIGLNQRDEVIIEEQAIPPPESFLGSITLIIVYSVTTEYTKYTCTLPEEKILRDTFIYQTRNFNFNVENVGNVPMKIEWSFIIDDEYPSRTDKRNSCRMEVLGEDDALHKNSIDDSFNSFVNPTNDAPSINENEKSNVTLFSESADRQSVDTWFEVDLPFRIVPTRACLKPHERSVFNVTFSPLDAFDFNVRLKSTIDNLDPYDQNISCKLTARSLIPYVHLDIEESDYLTSGRRKVTGVALPPHMIVLEFNVLGSGCYKKTFNVVNPTSEAYEFIFEMILPDKPELIPVHCNMLKGYVEGGTSTEVTFTFSPSAPGLYESQWKFIIPVYDLVMNLLVVGLVREPDVVFVPTILVIRNSLVGFTTVNEVILKNNESEPLKFEFKGNSMCNESGKTPVVVEPNQGTLRPRSETPIKMIYTPIEDGPLSFKIFCSVTYLTKYLTLCVNALSYLIKPTVTYFLIGNEHILNKDADTNIHLDQTASTYERTIAFVIKNDGSATFFYEWTYNCSFVKKYLQVYVEPKKGHVAPGNEVKCTLYFDLKKIPVQAFPVNLLISDGPEYKIFLYAEIEKPMYNFSCMDVDFGKCFINTPDSTYKKSIAFKNLDKVPILIDLNFSNLPELFVDYKKSSKVEPGKHMKIAIFFRPKQVKEYEFKLQFWVNSLCEEILTIRGEGIPLLFDLYEGCQKSFDLGHVKVGEKIIRTIEVMNHSKMPIEASYIFKDMYATEEETVQSDTTSVCLSPTTAQCNETGPSRVVMLQKYKDDKIQAQIAMDIENALSSLKVVPNRCTIKPYRKIPLKIQFKPVGMISTLNVQLNMKVFQFERPIVRLSGCATGRSLCFSQNSLQFGRVRKRGCKILKVMLLNKGNFGARFWWQPLKSNEFTISPQQGTIAAQTNVTFTITYRPTNHNPFVKVWASCNIENYMPLELALYATCVDTGNVQNKAIYLECPVREVITEYVTVTNPTDDLWLILSEVSGGPFDTLREFNVEPNSTFDIPVNFRPKTIGKHECQLLYSPLGESVLFVSVIGVAQQPNPNGTIHIRVAAKDSHTEELYVHNITENPETYKVVTELTKVVPDKFEGYYEIGFPATIKTWGEATATCRWTYVCYEECEMHLQVTFINEDSREYQYYIIIVTVTASLIVDTFTFESRARESVQKELIIKNPLSTDSDFFIKCDQLQCPDVLRINRNSKEILTMTYSPLVVGVYEDILEVMNYLAGTYLYKVILKCLPAKEKTLEFATSFGTSIPIRLRVQNRTENKTDFVCQVSHSSIQADSEYTLGALEKGKFLIWFEPTELGVQFCRVSFNSPVAGEFVFNIYGKGLRPKPQGPFHIKAGGFVYITFKNVFDDAVKFQINLDRDDFYVKTTYEFIKSKKDVKIAVFLIEEPAQGWLEMPTGTLTIQNYDPPAPKLYESQWKFIIPVYDLVMNLLVVGLVREPDVVFVPTILVIRNSLVGFTTVNEVILKNNESEPLKFEFKGNSMCNESGKTPVVVEPNQGTLRPRSETPIKMIYTPIEDGPLSFKIFCSVTYLTKYLTLCVNALSYLIKPTVTYFLIGNEHILNKDADTNIHLDQTASTYERTIAFVIKNDGSATFFYEWTYNCSFVKKYLQVYVEPKIQPTRKVSLLKIWIKIDLNFSNLPELFVDYKKSSKVEPGKHMKIAIFFRPKQVKEYEFKLQFWVNSLCEEILTIRGEGIPLLFDLYEGCQKSFDLGHVKVGEKIIRTIEVMNHSKMPIEASYIFKDMYATEEETVQSDTTSVCLSPTTAQCNETGPSRVVMLQKYKDDKIQAQIAMDIENALSSLKVVPNRCTIKPYRKIPLKIQFKPVGMISTLNVQLNMKVFQFERPIVRLSGCATGRSLCFSQNSLQFGRVRKRGCKILKVMLLNKGNFGARFWWQPLKSNEFTISPQQGTIAAQTNVTFTITYRPTNHNPFVKVWASCNIENYMPLELALYATCVDTGNVQNKAIYLECPVREVITEYVTVTNPTDDLWLILSEVSGGPFDTLREFNVEPNSTFDIPVNFRPKTIGKHECQLLYSPLGESVLFVSVIGVAQQPNPNGTIHIRVAAKDSHTEELYVHNITENPETYKVVTELTKVVPDKFEGYYEIGFPATIKTWGEATATCRWTYVCYEECEMHLQVTFINEDSREYQYYIIIVTVTASLIVDTFTFESRARESVQKELIIKNPLSTDSDFFIKCDQLQCPDVLRINRNSKEILTMTYSPLVVGVYEDILEVMNYLAGTYLYKVILKCLPAKEKTLEFATSFGTSIPIRLRVQNRTENKTDFVCQVSHSSIQADSEYTLGALEKGKFLIWFEPTELGVQFCRVSFNSPVAGEFVFNIYGKGLRPKPQGPFHIKAGGFVYITFKNVFDDAVKFQINLDRDDFYVKTTYEFIKSKKDVKIAVFLIEEPAQGWLEMPTGTLTIQNYDPPAPKVNWTYFLQGE